MERKSSIETEPRTLNIDQMQFAREAALYVLKTRTIEEAQDIFTEGLEPMSTNVAMEKGNVIISDSDDESCSDCFALAADGDQIHNHISPLFSTSATGLRRDVVSAPF